MRERAASPAPEAIARMAVQALLLEVGAFPKPGLVCPHSTGSHTDMDHALFVRSAHSLFSHFEAMACIGRETAVLPPEQVLPRLRPAGIRAEQAMFAATDGVNTHKGAIFSLGLLAAAASRVVSRLERPEPARVTAATAAMVRGIVDRELAALAAREDQASLTAGERLFLRYRITGIRGEAEAAFPAVMAALDAFYRIDRHHPLDLALPHMLLRLMARVEDSNVLHRGGPDALDYVRRAARLALAQGGMYRQPGRDQVALMEEEFVRRRLSPGGSADLLAATLFLHMVSREDPLLGGEVVKQEATKSGALPHTPPGA